MSVRSKRNIITSNDPLYMLRWRFALVLAIIGIVASIGGIIAQFVALEGRVTVVGMIGPAILLFLSLVVVILLRRESLAPASLILISGYSISLLLVSELGVLLLIGVLILISGATLGNRFIYILSNVIVFGRYGYDLLLIVQENQLTPTDEGSLLTIIISSLVIVSVTTRYFVSVANETARSAARTAELLRATADIGQITSRYLNRNELFEHSVELIRDRFAFYHVQIFLVDEQREYASLIASTGEVGERLISRGHRLRVGSQSVIGRVTQVGEPVVSLDTDTDNIHTVNELLPNTRSELALPIFEADRIIGALDVQSTQRNAFSGDDVQALQAMANQLSTSIRNAKLFEAQEHSVRENKRLFLEAETNLREIQRLNNQLVKNAWENYLSGNEEAGAVTLQDGDMSANAEWTPVMREAQRRHRPVTRKEGEQRITSVPVVLRGQVLGAIEVVTDDVREADKMEIVQAVAQRLVTNLDNIRLYEEAQAATEQEQRINSIVTNYQSAATVEDMLQITLKELSETLNADTGTIRMGLAHTHTPGTSSNGSSSHD